MEQYAAGAAAAPASRQPLCRLADDRDGWGGNFLAPILRSAGYRVIADGDPSAEAPDVLICLTGAGEVCSPARGDVPVNRLRMSIAAAGPGDDTVNRHERPALTDAMRRRMRGEGEWWKTLNSAKR